MNPDDGAARLDQTSSQLNLKLEPSQVHSSRPVVHSTVEETIKNDGKKVWRFLKCRKLSKMISVSLLELQIFHPQISSRGEARDARSENSIYRPKRWNFPVPWSENQSSFGRLRFSARSTNCYSDCLKFLFKYFYPELYRGVNHNSKQSRDVNWGKRWNL